MTFAEAGAAIRRWREGREWRLEDIAERTGLDITLLSFMERGMRKPQKKTIGKLEDGLGWPSGFFYELVAVNGDPDALDRMLEAVYANTQPSPSVVVRRITQTDVFEDYAEASGATLESVIRHLPPPESPRFDHTVLAALSQCGRAEVLAADSWRVASVSDRDGAPRLLKVLREDLESKRRVLLERIPGSVAARFDAACRSCDLPEALIGLLTGLSSDEIWQIRSGGAVPEGANTRLATFIKAVETDGP